MAEQKIYWVDDEGQHEATISDEVLKAVKEAKAEAENEDAAKIKKIEEAYRESGLICNECKELSKHVDEMLSDLQEARHTAIELFNEYRESHSKTCAMAEMEDGTYKFIPDVEADLTEEEQKGVASWLAGMMAEMFVASKRVDSLFSELSDLLED